MNFCSVLWYFNLVFICFMQSHIFEWGSTLALSGQRPRILAYVRTKSSEYVKCSLCELILCLETNMGNFKSLLCSRIFKIFQVDLHSIQYQKRSITFTISGTFETHQFWTIINRVPTTFWAYGQFTLATFAEIFSVFFRFKECASVREQANSCKCPGNSTCTQTIYL